MCLALYGTELEEDEDEEEEDEQLEVHRLPDLLFRDAPQLLQYTAALRSSYDSDYDGSDGVDSEKDLEIQRERRGELRLDSSIGIERAGVMTLKAQTHRTGIKELAATKADCCVASQRLHLGQKIIVEHTEKTTANGQLACTFCDCARGNNFPFQQAAIVCIRHSKRETGRPRTADIQDVVMKRT